MGVGCQEQGRSRGHRPLALASVQAPGRSEREMSRTLLAAIGLCGYQNVC